jgi:mono/diheme cytochrome c family protein
VNTEVESKTRAIPLGVAFFMLVCAGIALSSTVRAANDTGFYTQDQATRGHQLFNNYCAQCHMPDLTGAAGPALIGDQFRKDWGTKTVGELFSFEHSNMPANNPGSVPDDTMWSITAYILQKNGFPAGSTALSQPTGASKLLAAAK